MPDTTSNDTANVSTGKGVKGGYWFSAPASTENLALITSESLKDFSAKVTETLADSVNLGYISEDGWVESEDRESDDFKDVNGDIIDSSTSSRTENIAVTMVEVKESSLAEQYGHGNVSDADGVITALHTSDEHDERIYVADLVLKNGRRWRQIVPKGKVGEIGDLTIKSGQLVGREAKIKCGSFSFKNKSVTVIDYFQSSAAAPAEEEVQQGNGGNGGN